MIELQEIERFDITGRGPCFVCNGIGTDERRDLLGQQVLISGKIWKVVGIENGGLRPDLLAVLVREP